MNGKTRFRANFFFFAHTYVYVSMHFVHFIPKCNFTIFQFENALHIDRWAWTHFSVECSILVITFRHHEETWQLWHCDTLPSLVYFRISICGNHSFYICRHSSIYPFSACCDKIYVTIYNEQKIIYRKMNSNKSEREHQTMKNRFNCFELGKKLAKILLNIKYYWIPVSCVWKLSTTIDPLQKVILTKWIILQSNKILNLFMSYHKVSDPSLAPVHVYTFPQIVIELWAILNSCYHNICESLLKGNGSKSIESMRLMSTSVSQPFEYYSINNVTDRHSYAHHIFEITLSTLAKRWFWNINQRWTFALVPFAIVCAYGIRTT